LSLEGEGGEGRAEWAWGKREEDWGLARRTSRRAGGVSNRGRRPPVGRRGRLCLWVDWREERRERRAGLAELLFWVERGAAGEESGGHSSKARNRRFSLAPGSPSPHRFRTACAPCQLSWSQPDHAGAAERGEARAWCARRPQLSVVARRRIGGWRVGRESSASPRPSRRARPTACRRESRARGAQGRAEDRHWSQGAKVGSRRAWGSREVHANCEQEEQAAVPAALSEPELSAQDEGESKEA